MKKNLVKILSCVLAAVAVFTLIGSAGSLKDVTSAKEYWETQRLEALDSFDMLDDGIYELSQNKTAYTEGVETYEEGQEAYEAGQIKLMDGQEEFDANEVKLMAAHQQYDDGVKALREGKQKLEAGKKELENGKAVLASGKAAYAQGLKDYEAGKQKLAEGEATLAAEYDNYVAGKQKLDDYYIAYAACKAMEAELNDAKAKLAQAQSSLFPIGIEDLMLEVAALQAAYDLAMKDIIGEYEEGQALIAQYEQGRADVARGKAELAEAEKKLAQAEEDIARGEAKVYAGEAEIKANEEKIAEAEKKLEESKKLLDENDAKLEEARETLEAGAEELEKGADSLSDGLKKLNLYEGGQLELANGLDLVIANDTYYNKANEPLVESIKDRLGEGFNYWTTDGNGKIVLLNNSPFVDLDKAKQVSDTGRAFLEDIGAAVTSELTGKAISLFLACAAAVVGIVAAVLAFFGKLNLSTVLSVISGGLGLAGLALSLIKGVEQPFSHIAGTTAVVSGLVVICAITVAAAAHSAASFAAKGKKAKE